MCRFACLFQVEVWRSSDVVTRFDFFLLLLLCDRNQESQLKVCTWTFVCVQILILQIWFENAAVAEIGWLIKLTEEQNSVSTHAKKIYSIYTVNFIAVKTIYIIRTCRTNYSKFIRSIPFYSVQKEKEKWNENEERQCSISIVRHQLRNLQLFTRTNVIRKMPKEAS